MLRVLDLFCGAGGATKGYQLAGFHVTGVDLRPQPRYCGDDFMQMDALWFLADRGYVHLLFDAIHASPPCQAKTTMSNRWRGRGGLADEHVDLIPETRRLLLKAGLPYVIENVPGARSSLRIPGTLTGEMFGLGVHRPRLFETNWSLLVPEKPKPSPVSIGVYGKHHDGRLLWRRKDGTEQRAASTLKQAREAMGIDWMEWRELAESIPPSYTEFVGAQLLEHLATQAAA